MEPYNTDIKKSLKWMHNTAPGITGLITKKTDWYQSYHHEFWDGWRRDVFDLRTANNFGLMVWCILLGAPSDPFGLYPELNSWAYGPERQNFIDSGGHTNIEISGEPSFYYGDGSGEGTKLMPGEYTFNHSTYTLTLIATGLTGQKLFWSGKLVSPTGFSTDIFRREFATVTAATNYKLLAEPSIEYNTLGGNFSGGGETTIIGLDEVRWALQLRYAALVGNGRLEYINRMLAWIFNDGKPWDLSSGRYFYLMDGTGKPSEPPSDVVVNLPPPFNNPTVSPTGLVTFATAPLVDMDLTWSGTWNGVTVDHAEFGTGDGISTIFQLKNPPGASAAVTKPYYMEYRVGPAMNLSSQFINLLNQAQYGMIPSCAGIGYKVIQE